MAARVGDLVDDAQAQAWGLIQPFPEDHNARGAAAEAQAHAQIAAWPGLAKASILALRTVPLAEQDKRGRLAVLEALTGIARREGAASPAEPAHPRLDRMTHILGAVADLLHGETEQVSDRAHDAVALFDRLSAAIETAATNTIAYCDVAHAYAATPEAPEALTYLAATLRARRTTPPAERVSSLDDVALTGPGDTGLAAAVAAWQQQARATLVPTEAARSSDAVRRLAGDLALLSRTTATTLQAGAAAGVIDKGAAEAAARSLAQAVQAWAIADTSWRQNPRAVSGAGPSPAQDVAHRALHAAVTVEFRAEGAWLTVDELGQRPNITRMAQDARRTARSLAQIGDQYAHTVATLGVACEKVNYPTLRFRWAP
ncbi:hypothetical protein [Arsenicicoccus bolidensis]|uniref:hypothetical protein n=1 Tax=Arsenicicoccus bolidensis TaxID=229480 RepID=UPI000401359B|nr:hypothetical protein [Arsenicicoccus bolidensis]